MFVYLPNLLYFCLVIVFKIVAVFPDLNHFLS